MTTSKRSERNRVIVLDSICDGLGHVPRSFATSAISMASPPPTRTGLARRVGYQLGHRSEFRLPTKTIAKGSKTASDNT
jgi:hypothetical protein